MKLIIGILIFVAGLVVACGPASPIDNSTQAEPNSPVATPATDSQIESPVPNPTPAGETGQINWNHSPDQRIIQAIFCCGFTTRNFAMNYLAEATVWGDGRIVWVEQSPEGARQVLEGHLTMDQLNNLFQRVVETGFFDWDERYANEMIADAADKCLQITIENRSKEVCEYVEGAPPAFHDLYAEVAAGAGATGTPYVPKRGYLTATVLPEGGDFSETVEMWPEEAAGFSLSEATGGRWVEGEALDTAWRVVNQGPFTAVEEGETYYELTLQLPDLSLTELPLE